MKYVAWYSLVVGVLMLLQWVFVLMFAVLLCLGLIGLHPLTKEPDAF